MALLAPTERMDIGRDHLERDRIEAPFPCRHHAVAGIGDLGGDGVLGRAVKPDSVCEVRRAQLLVATAVGAVTGGALLLEQLGKIVYR
mgnify:CR=1 FL=1